MCFEVAIFLMIQNQRNSAQGSSNVGPSGGQVIQDQVRIYLNYDGFKTQILLILNCLYLDVTI